MERSLINRLSQALQRIDRPGSYCVSGSLPAILPGLEVEGVGGVGLPLTPLQARELRKVCHQAPYGKGEQTLVDTSVRNVWRLEPEHFSLTNPQWESYLQQIVSRVQEELGLEKQKLQAHLYDLLLYEPGSYFLPHKDGEKLDRMVGTLVVMLPSSYEGGELIVRHDGQEQVIDFSNIPGGAFQIHYAAFYADCEHEIRPVRSGHRLCLVYNLTLARGKRGLTAPSDSEHIDTIAAILSEWARSVQISKLLITLAHQYTQDGLAWDTLKGVDRVRARVLNVAAQRARCRAYLGLLTFYELGSAYEEGGGSGSGWSDDWEDDESEEDEDEEREEEEEVEAESDYVMDEVMESYLTLSHCVDAQGRQLPLAELDVEEDELLDPKALTKVKPKEEFEGYTGNAGMTLQRWYHHAAIALWPENQNFEILCGSDGRQGIPLLKEMLAQWQAASGADAAALRDQCLGLVSAILNTWPAFPPYYSHSAPSFEGSEATRR